MKKVYEEKNGAMLTREKVEDLSKKVDDLQKKNIPSENNSSLKKGARFFIIFLTTKFFCQIYFLPKRALMLGSFKTKKQFITRKKLGRNKNKGWLNTCS